MQNACQELQFDTHIDHYTNYFLQISMAAILHFKMA